MDSRRLDLGRYGRPARGERERERESAGDGDLRAGDGDFLGL
jgi:hypothetical protein